MSGAPKTEDFEADVDYVNEDDDDDDEDDFVPGAEEEQEDGEDDIVPLLDGYLYVDDSQSLHYQGDGFHLSSTEPPAWNVIGPDAASRALGDSLELIMTGPCDFESAQESKATPRKMKVTFSIMSSTEIDPILGELAAGRRKPPQQTAAAAPEEEKDATITSDSGAAVKAGDDDDDDDDGKVKAAPKEASAKGTGEAESSSSQKVAALVHRVFGHQIDTHGGDAMEFVGVFYPPKQKEQQVSLTCQVRIIPTAAPSAAMAAAAVASSTSARIDKEDDEEDEEYEEGVDYDELIALHEDAGMSVDALQKRYRGSEAPEGKPKRPKRGASSGDEDDDYGF